MKKAIQLLLIIFLMTGNAWATQELIIVGDDDFFPYCYLEEGKITGLNVDIIREMAKRLDLTVHIKLKPFQRIMSELKSGKIDAGFTILMTEERLEYGWYVHPPLHYSIYYFYVKPGKEFPFKDISDIHGKKIGILRGFSISKEFDMAVKQGKIEVVEVNDNNALIEIVSLGRVDAIAGNVLVMRAALKQIDTELIQLAKPIRPPRGVYLVLSKATQIEEKVQLYEKMNHTLINMLKDGTIDRITREYAP